VSTFTLITDRPAAQVRDVELSAPIPALDHADGARAWLVVRLFTEPLGLVVVDVPPAGTPAGEVLRAIRVELDSAIAPRLAQVGLVPESALGQGFTPLVTPRFLVGRREALDAAEPVTVVICTRDRPFGLQTTLRGLVALDHPGFRVVVVDSASRGPETRQIALEFVDRLDLRYLRVERPGLSRARNAGLAAVETPLVAWLDDDATPDRHWLTELARAFAEGPHVHAVSGTVVPRTLARQEQVWFEEFGGHSKGRGFARAEFAPHPSASRDLATRESGACYPRVGSQHPMYPLPAFGVGANMAFRTAALRAAGGFDDALGAGTLTRGGEDTLAFTEVMLRGGTMVYQPSALVRHDHRETLAALAAQLDGYGSGLTAYYTALLLKNPLRIFALLRLAPGALRDLRDPAGVRNGTLGTSFPPELMASNLRSMLRGPWLYLKERFTR
jgi:GT2 family glycosyltransferase